ncbi:MAG: UDP-glucose 4-epimerase GalE [Hymenobacteraceae bacterium]|nr:UDP-glucose 4-epimerase GalE [Hymenobacteraceae bacterium]
MKILVTGGAGFIGSHAVVALAEAGFEPVIVDNLSNSQASAVDGIAAILGRRVAFHQIDCTDEVALDGVFRAEGTVAGVIHFAAYKAVGESVAEPVKYYRNNVGSLLALLAAMERANCQGLVFSSSCTVYGIPDTLPVTEAAPTHRANSPYGNTKQVCEDILADLAASGRTAMRTSSLRYFNPIGAHPSARIGELPLGVPNNLVPFVTQTAAGLRERLTIYGTDYDTPDGSCVRDYIHVVDLADAHVVALRRLLATDTPADRPALETFNLGTGHGHSVLEVVREFERVSGRALPVTLGPRRAGDVPAIYGDVTRATNELGWCAQRTLADALTDAWRWQQALVATAA